MKRKWPLLFALLPALALAHYGNWSAFLLPAGASESVATPGAVAVDTSADQLVYYGGSARVLDYRGWATKAYMDPNDADEAFIMQPPMAITITGVNCIAASGTSIDVDVQECTSAGASCATVLSSAVTCDTNGASATISDGGIAADGWVKSVMSNESGTVGSVAVSLRWTVDRQ